MEKTSQFSSQDEIFMRRALQQARIAFDAGEVPIGAVLVCAGGELIFEGYNQVEATKDASCHAELLCMRRAAVALGQWRLIDAVLYSTVEPCGMCAAALASFRIKKVIWGAKEPRVGAAGSLFNFFAIQHPIHQVQSEGGLLAEECSAIIKLFFKQRRHARDPLHS